MKLLAKTTLALLVLLSAFGCPRAPEKPTAEPPGRAEPPHLARAADIPALKPAPDMPAEQAHLSVEISAASLKAAEKPFSMEPTDISLSDLADNVSVGGGSGSSFGFVMGVTCGLDNEGRWHCTPFTRELEDKDPEGGYWVSRKDATMLEVGADVKVDGKEYETAGELKIEEGRSTVLHLPPEGEPKYSFTFTITRSQAAD